MAFTRKFLSALGIEEDKIEQIMEAHVEVTNALKKDRDDAKEKADTLDNVQKELNDTKKKLKAYEDADGDDSWEKKYNDAVTEKKKAEDALADYKAGIEAKEALTTKQNAYKELLKEKKVSDKRLDAILKVTDFDKIELDNDGKIKDVENVGKNIETEWGDFITTKTEEGAGVGNPPANNGGNGTNGLSRAAQLAQKHHESLYGKIE